MPNRAAATMKHHLGEDPHVVEAIHTAPPIIKKSRMVYAISDVLSRDAGKINYNTLKVGKPRPAGTDAHTPLVQRESSMQQSSEHRARLRIGRARGIDLRDYGTWRSGGLPMKSLFVAVSTLAMLACLASSPVASQQRGVEPGLQLHAVNPSLSLSTPTNSPLPDQKREDYATSLRGTQRELLRQNPSGLTPEGLAIGRELNGYMGPR